MKILSKMTPKMRSELLLSINLVYLKINFCSGYKKVEKFVTLSQLLLKLLNILRKRQNVLKLINIVI